MAYALSANYSMALRKKSASLNLNTASANDAIMHTSKCIIPLAYSRLGGLEGEALQRQIFLLLLFASGAGKKQQQKNNARGLRPRSPAGELASNIMYKDEQHVTR